jgi:hypothetical protein
MTREASNTPSRPGSEQMAWKLFPGLERICDLCKRELRIKDVGEHRAWIEQGRRVREVFWCVDHRGGNHKRERL